MVKRGAHGFTLIELLIVITIIGILVALIAGVATRATDHQRITLTQTVLRNTMLAIDQFKEANPLRNVYDAKEGKTFGPYPPYQLDRASIPRAMNRVLEPSSPVTLSDRLKGTSARPGDLQNLGSTAPIIKLQDGQDKVNNDIRALYTYLRVFTKPALSLIPERNMRPLTQVLNQPEYVDPTGSNAPNKQLEVLGIYDAWGVPLDYFLYVKMEWGTVKTRDASGNEVVGAGWRVADRVPVLRSRGVSLEEYKAGRSDPKKWIFNSPFPSPALNEGNSNFWRDGLMSIGMANLNGWARARAEEESYGYVPDPQEK